MWPFGRLGGRRPIPPHDPIWQLLRLRPALPPMDFAIGLMQHPQTGAHQVWASLDGADVTWITARADRGDAARLLEPLRIALSAELWLQPPAMQALFRQLQSGADAMTRPLPDYALRILRRAIDEQLAAKRRMRGGGA